MHGCEIRLPYSQWQSSQRFLYSQDSSFRQNCEFSPTAFFLTSVCCVLSAIFYASLVSEWVLAAVPTWALFSSLWNILWQRQHSTMLCVLLYTLPTTKWGEIKVYSACLRGSTVCIGNLLSNSTESVAYCCSLVLHVASIPKNMMN